MDQKDALNKQEPIKRVPSNAQMVKSRGLPASFLLLLNFLNEACKPH
jgi:hypothetical protein